jgi:hypothetical protein
MSNIVSGGRRSRQPAAAQPVNYRLNWLLHEAMQRCNRTAQMQISSLSRRLNYLPAKGGAEGQLHHPAGQWLAATRRLTASQTVKQTSR